MDNPISAYKIVFDTVKLREIIKLRGLEEVIKNAQRDIESGIKSILEITNG